MSKSFTFGRPLAAAIFLLLGCATAGWAQGVTTASVGGVVTGKLGDPLPGAAVVAVHLPTGTRYGTVTQPTGRYSLTNLRVGGPYTVVVSYVGYETKTVENVFLNLGTTDNVRVELAESSQQLGEVVVSGNQGATGGETQVTNAQITRLPTIRRSFEDFARLTPQSTGFSFAGRNRLFNNLTIDGSIFNNPFGLDAPLPGGQTNSQPISLDAIDQILVAISPFDVRQSGFTGASVNAVTKSGTNKFRGSVYTFLRNESLIGTRVGDARIQNPPLSYNQSGFSLGGPIVKNKLFFFVSGELERRNDLATPFVATRSGLDPSTNANVSFVSAADLDEVASVLDTRYNYKPGAYENYKHQTYNNKLSAKLDWNINDRHALTVSYKYLRSFRDVLPNPAISRTGRGPNKFTIPFENNSYVINNNINSLVAELNSRFSNGMANKLQVSYTSFRDFRDSKSAAFPSVDILRNGNNYISFGLERFSTNNKLDQDVLQLTNNTTFYLGNHTLTAGVNFENFRFLNSFNLFYYPGYQFESMDEFRTRTVPTNAKYANFNGDVQASSANPFRADRTSFSQLGLYAQDEWQVTDKLKLNLGLRADLPIYGTTLPAQPSLAALTFYTPDNAPVTGIPVNRYPRQRLLWSPRVGFNFDLKGDKSLVLRGGTGIFTGRIPFVWLGNQSANNFLAPFYTFQVNTTANNFNFPQVWRSNLALDAKLPGGITASLDLLFGKDLNAVVHRNYNMRTPTGTGPDGRPIFVSGQERVNVEPVSPINNLPSFLDAGLIVMENTNQGYQYSITGQLNKTFGNVFFASVSYTYGQSRDITSNPGEIAANAFQSLPTAGNPNRPGLAFADHDLRHRLVLAGSYRKEYGKHFATSVGLFYEWLQGGVGNVIGDVGGRYSFVYGGDANRDGIGGNDLLYIPRSQSEINLVPFVLTDRDGTITRTYSPDEQWRDLNAFIAQDPYLNANRGRIADRNGAILPGWGKADFKFVQDFFINVKGQKNTLQLSFDVLNVTNLLNPNWGVRRTLTTRSPLSVSYNAQGAAEFQFPLLPNGQPVRTSFVDDTTLNSRWQAQVGIRYIFN